MAGPTLEAAVADLADMRNSASDGELWRVLDLVPIPILLAEDPDCLSMHANRAGQRLFMVSEGRNIAQSSVMEERPNFQIYAGGEVVPLNDLPMQKAGRLATEVGGAECELRFQDGSIKHTVVHSAPLFHPDGQVRGSIGAFIDITQRKLLEQHNVLLTRELNHRAKNSFSIVQAIAQQTLKPKLPAHDFDAFEGRLVALGRASTLLSLTNWRSAPVEEVVRGALEPIVPRNEARVHCRGPGLDVSPRGAVSLTMAVHELATNACKYGALSAPEGEVDIHWSPVPKRPNALAFTWVERGGPKVRTPSRAGFGTKLLELLLKQAPGDAITTRYNPTGLEFEAVSGLLG